MLVSSEITPPLWHTSSFCGEHKGRFGDCGDTVAFPRIHCVRNAVLYPSLGAVEDLRLLMMLAEQLTMQF